MPVFTANIPTILRVGDRIEIGGKIKDNARKMSVNLCAQEGEEPRDVVLHFDVRFHRDNIISLSRKNGIWIGSGNYDTNYNMFVPGTLFRIVFEIKDTDVITIYCQGKFHSNFLPKIPLSMARYVVAWADVDRITHCYFHIANKPASGDEAVPSAECPYAPRTAPPSMLIGDVKRGQRSRRRKTPEMPRQLTSNDSSEEEAGPKSRPNAEGRADRYFYDTLMCQPPAEALKCRAGSSPTRGRTLPDASDTDGNDSGEYSEELASRNMDSSMVESEVAQVAPHDARKRHQRRAKLPPFAQIVNFTGKTAKRS